ncbi:hypothetical protein VRRI112168_16510 [Vreelandella rituensis]
MSPPFPPVKCKRKQAATTAGSVTGSSAVWTILTRGYPPEEVIAETDALIDELEAQYKRPA